MTNRPIENLKDVETIWCDDCLKEENQQVVAAIYCHECKKNLCESCDSIHKFPRFKKHTRTDPLAKSSDEILNKNCQIHKDSKLTRYCTLCQMLICDKCLDEHTNHETVTLDSSTDFLNEIAKLQKLFYESQLEKISSNIDDLNNPKKSLQKNQKTVLDGISEFYSNQKKLLCVLEKNEKKITNTFFDQVYKWIKADNEKLVSEKNSYLKYFELFKKLEQYQKQSKSFQFFRQLSKINSKKDFKNPKYDHPRFCKEHYNRAYEFFCLDCKQLGCSHCSIMNHSKCKRVTNFKEGYEKIKNEIGELTKTFNSKLDLKKKLRNEIKNEKLNVLKEKQIHIEITKKNYIKLNEQIQLQFKNMIEEISIKQNEKFLQLNFQLNKIQEEIKYLEKSEIIQKEIEICKKSNNYQEILINYFKLKKLKPILNNDNNKLICDPCFDKINYFSNDLQKNLKNWKLYPFDNNKIQISIPSVFFPKEKFQCSFIFKNHLDEILTTKDLILKGTIFKENSNEIIAEITKFQETNNDQELIGEYLFKEEGEYQINFTVNGQKFQKSPFAFVVIDLFWKESEILQKENNLKFYQILDKWIKEAGCNTALKRRFNSRTDGWKYQTFHQKCDNKGKSIVLIKLKNKSLFGGFAAVDWDSKSDWKQSTGNKSFLFSLISLDRKFTQPLKMPVFRNQSNEIYCNQSYGPLFGNGHDLQLGYSSYNMNNNSNTYSNLGYTYKPPFGYTKGSTEAMNFLAGSYRNWEISQIEIFCEN
ncbi:pep-cterm sorting domain-containing protein [Anaeramoeba flamelloides]|uniref:Pep-cterm sorting domain-containing protein n=1 Tax=Anaeramoeba flamelloides TaxID=1746091 RepID=A0ABQ8XHR2_9EUKA|nr:pep-cterm sorting domain-containing protein [Anaeramoeba flamelloides]